MDWSEDHNLNVCRLSTPRAPANNRRTICVYTDKPETHSSPDRSPTRPQNGEDLHRTPYRSAVVLR
jgi:hypothetical protein